MVELHSAIFPEKFQKIVSKAEIIADKKKIEGSDAWILSVNHQMVLNFVHDQLVDDDFKYKTMLIKGLYDFYLLARLAPQGGIKLSVKGYEMKFNTYCSFVSSIFNNSQAIQFTENLATRKLKRNFDYLLNHPKVFGFYQLLILYSIRIPIILKSFITAPFSKHSRRYIKKKAGSVSAIKGYFQKLKQGF